MPNRTVYIRAADLPAWEALEGKSESISRMLNATRPSVPYTLDVSTGSIAHGAPILTPKNKDMDFCKHGSVKGFCKKGCK